VSAFSMNVRIPLSELHNAFYVILFLAVISVVASTLYWRHKNW